MASNPKRRYTVKEYFEIEKASPIKHEFIYGEIIVMGGASERHNTIANNVNVRLWLQILGTNCRCYMGFGKNKISQN